MRTALLSHLMILGNLIMSQTATSSDFKLSLRHQVRQKSPDLSAPHYERKLIETSWSASETAIIVCDVWDKHHSLNAVRRMEEFLPRMNDVLTAARQKGSTIIHSPSDCMPAYEGHAARQRAINGPSAATQPEDIEFWCSKIPSEEQAVYPIDQSDGGDDDDPTEHAKWAAELKALGRNPGLPWKSQHAGIEINEQLDFISDKGDEVWNILESRGIRNVILVGVHTNMCVLGRPFGLRQLARNGKNVVLMRDLTDCMYNPKSWPFVDHFTGNDLIISHVERFVCPTITSDQIVGGIPFVSQYDKRDVRDVLSLRAKSANRSEFSSAWTTQQTGLSLDKATGGLIQTTNDPLWFRCTLRVPSQWLSGQDLHLDISTDSDDAKAWLNGTELKTSSVKSRFDVPVQAVIADDINLLVIQEASNHPKARLLLPPIFRSGDRSIELDGRWQFRIGSDESFSNIPLPAKFGIGSDVLFEAKRSF